VAKIVDKQAPSADDIAKNLDSQRDALLNQRRDQMYEVFVSELVTGYEKSGRVLLNKKMQQTPMNGM
jgi:peptidyl-prolyl cis-trans isomerase D